MSTKTIKYSLKDLKTAYRADKKFWSTGDVDYLDARTNACRSISEKHWLQIESILSFANRTGHPIQTVIDVLKMFGFEPKEQETDNEHTV